MPIPTNPYHEKNPGAKAVRGGAAGAHVQIREAEDSAYVHARLP